MSNDIPPNPTTTLSIRFCPECKRLLPLADQIDAAYVRSALAMMIGSEFTGPSYYAICRKLEDAIAAARLAAPEAKEPSVDTERPDAEEQLREEAEGTHELFAHFRDENRRLSEALRLIEGAQVNPAASFGRDPAFVRWVGELKEIARAALRDTEQEPER